VSWRVITVRYAIGIATREAIRSDRWTIETKGVLAVTLVPLILAFVTAVELFWIVVGRGRRIRHALGQDIALVLPFPARLPPHITKQLDEMRARNAAEQQP
jgi:hypothetical protein